MSKNIHIIIIIIMGLFMFRSYDGCAILWSHPFRNYSRIEKIMATLSLNFSERIVQRSIKIKFQIFSLSPDNPKTGKGDFQHPEIYYQRQYTCLLQLSQHTHLSLKVCHTISYILSDQSYFYNNFVNQW